jgi:biotin carboxyl carrier protein
MRKLISVASDASTWTATVDGDHVVLAEAEATFAVTDDGDGRFRAIGQASTVVGSAAASGDVIWIGIDGHVLAMKIGTGTAAARPAARDADSLAPLMPATVVKIHVRPGDRVQNGDILVTLEAMKMEMPIRAPRAGTIAAVHCSEGSLAPVGEPVVTLE